MNFRDYRCEKCKIIFEKAFDSINSPGASKSKCPKCKKFALRYYSVVGMAAAKVSGTKHKVQRIDVQKVYEAELEDSKIRLSKDYQMKHSPYKSYKPNIDKMVKEGAAKRCSPERLSKKIEAAKRLTAQVYDIAKVDPKKGRRRTNDD